MANGTTKRVSDVKIGDQVLATNTETGETQARTVTDTMVMHHDGDLLDVTVRAQDGEGVIQTTDSHPFWSVTDQKWENAIQLSVGEQLRQADGSAATVVRVIERPGRQAMHDLTVEVDHNFYIDFGDGAVLVHNAGPLPNPGCGIPKSPRGRGTTPKSQRDPKRQVTAKEREQMLKDQGNQCAGCGEPVDKSSPAHHYPTRHADGGRSTPDDEIILCQVCHDWVHSR
jgi:hypothetical protein